MTQFASPARPASATGVTPAFRGRAARHAALLRGAVMLASTVGVLPGAAFAQIIVPVTTTDPYINQVVGAPASPNPGSDGDTGGTAGAGNDGGDLSFNFGFNSLPVGSTAPAVIIVGSAGSDGGVGGNSTSSTTGNGGHGGDGGNAGSLTLFTQGNGSGSQALMDNAGTGSVFIATNRGGTGGNGGDSGHDGQDGTPGNGGIVGSITFNVADAFIASKAAGVAAIVLTSTGGSGGNHSANDDSSGPGKKIGTSGGDAADGGNIFVDLENTGSTPASPTYVDSGGSALEATSQGGNGGDGGRASGGLGSYGGTGGSGGAGGQVRVTLGAGVQVSATGALTTGGGAPVALDTYDPTTKTYGTGTGITSAITAGLMASSYGGTGGWGGGAQGNFGAAGAGPGGAAGAGGAVVIALAGGEIEASGTGGLGVLALSVGGDGGNGATAAGGIIRHGGRGAGGGDGSEVSITLSGLGSDPYRTVETQGDGSDTIVAMSIGGGGGFGGTVTGGSIGISISLGGIGGVGGNGGVVSIANGAWIPGVGSAAGSFAPAYAVVSLGEYSRALSAMSIGGGGGRGGDATAIDLGILSQAIGGSGGKGGDGNTVTLANFGILQTSGAHSTGVDAQSIGGGGGAGGGAVSLEVGTQLTISVAVGGSGGTGGVGGEVLLANLYQVITSGSDAYAVKAQSIGGGGGDGGASSASSLQLPGSDEAPQVQLTTSIGGTGGSGGSGGYVFLLNSGLVMTQGLGATGLFAQSIGGGGGTGGDSSTLALSNTTPSIVITTTIGGKGGSGGNGGAIDVYNSGLVWTLNDQAPGIVAQSVGGGGGTGGFANSNTASYSGNAKQPTLQVSVSVGGSGGAAGNGGDITVYNSIGTNLVTVPVIDGFVGAPLEDFSGGGAILTFGDMSDGIYAHSIGGGGGNGGNGTAHGSGGQVNVNIGVGGSGGAGGNGGTILVDNGDGVISTSGAGSAGVFAQSVGGGGGRGGTGAAGGGTNPNYLLANYAGAGLGVNASVTKAGENLWDVQNGIKAKYNDLSKLSAIEAGYDSLNAGGSPTIATPSPTTIDLDVGGGWGGKGGSAGIGGNVQIDSIGTIYTAGPNSAGLFAQSVGGGGGQGGAATAKISNNATTAQAYISGTISVGGNGGSNGDGGTIVMSNSGIITTAGDLSAGMMGQSIGGGGGQSVVTISTPLVSDANGSLGINFGGRGSANGGGGTVNMYNYGAITTTGDDSIGMMGQSIGGGGGQLAVMSSILSIAEGASQTAAPVGVVQSISLSGQGGENAAGGAVNVTLESGGTISTSGTNSYGILAQSIGNGGGVVVGNDANLTGGNLFTPRGENQEYYANNGGTVYILTATNTSIATGGDGAVGILAQSIGGGGGIIGGMAGARLNTGEAANSEKNGDESGYGGDITINSSSNITTTGQYAYGIFAQSITNGGGVIGNATGTGTAVSGQYNGSYCNVCNGNIDITLNAGTILVSGVGSYAIFAETKANDDGVLAVTVNANSNVVARGAAAGGIFLSGTTTETVKIYGSLDTSATASNTAFTAYTGATAYLTVEQGGRVTGGTNALGGGNISVTGNIGGTIEMGDMQLGPGGVIRNYGIIGAGASGKVAATKITGDFIQGSTGTLLVDTDIVSGKADLITVTGKADIAGTVRIQPSSVTNKAFTVLTAAGGITLQPSLASTNTTQLFGFTPKVSGNTLLIQPTANFTTVAAGLGSNQRAVAATLQSLFDTGASMDHGFNALSKITDRPGYAKGLNTLSGQTLGALAAFRFNSSHSFVASMYSGCASFDQAGAAIDEAACGWARMLGSSTRQDTTADALGYSATTGAFQLGLQRQIGEHWYLSGSLAYEMSKFTDNEHGTRITGSSVLAGAYLRYHNGPLQASIAADTGYGWYQSRRSLAVGNLSETARAAPHESQAGVHARVAYQLPLGVAAYARPFVDGHVVRVHGDAYTERGASPFNLAIDAQGKTAVAAAAGIEVGGRIKLASGGFVRPFASAAFEVLNGNDWSTTAHFAEQPGSDSFRALTPAPDRLGKFTLGLDFVAARNVDLSLTYTPEVGTGYVSHAGIARLAYRF